MHGMFVQVIVVFFAVAFSELVIILHNVVHLVPDIFVIAQRVVRKLRIDENLCLKVRVERLVCVEVDCAIFKGFIASAKIVHRVFDRVKNVLFFFTLWVGISCHRILQAPKLGVRVAAKRVNRALGQKQVRIVNQLLTERVQVQIMFLIQPEQLDCVWVAV